MLSVGEQFVSFDDLSKRVLEFQKSSYVQSYIRSSRSIESAARHTQKRKFNDAKTDSCHFTFIST